MRRRIISLLIIGVIALLGIVLSAILGYLPNLLPDLFTERAWLFWSIVGGIVLLLSGYGMAQWVQTQPGPATSSIDSEQAKRNRLAMLEKVWSTWIEGVLRDSLYKETLIALGMQARPDAVKPPRNAVVQRLHQADQLLPPETPIIQVFDNSHGALLILGAPGSGKTTLLLELARDLIERAGQDTNHPIPVIFPLSTWAVSRRPLADWLVDELVNRYTVPRKVAQAWIASNAVLPLLDGLDEVVPSARDSCVEAINVFRATRGQLPIAVCSRIADYEVLTVKLRLYRAIVVQPLSREQVRQYVREIGFPITPKETSPLWNLLTTPLMLNIATLAYVSQPAESLRTSGGVADSQDHLIAAYVERRLSQAAPNSPYFTNQIQHYLSWLAWQMQRHNQTVFYIEYMQPHWLPRKHRWLPIVGADLILVFFGLFLGLIASLRTSLGVGLLFGLVLGLFFGPYYSGISGYSREIRTVETVHWSWSHFRAALWLVVLRGLLLGLSVGLMYVLGIQMITQWSIWSIHQLITMSGREDLLNPSVRLLMALVTVPGGGLRGGIIVGLVVGLVSALAVGMFHGLSRAEISTKAVPSQGIWRSAKNALILGLFYGFVASLIIGISIGILGGLSIGLAWGLPYGQAWGLTLGLAGAMSGGLLGGVFGVLHYGGRACLQHLVLRILLIRQGAMSWDYVQFLDFAASRILLRKVGGGYIFIHRLLLDYFAKQYTGPETAEQGIPRRDS